MFCGDEGDVLYKGQDIRKTKAAISDVDHVHIDLVGAQASGWMYCLQDQIVDHSVNDLIDQFTA